MAKLQMTTPLLFTYRRCPYAMGARMALLVAGIVFDGQICELLRFYPQVNPQFSGVTVAVYIRPNYAHRSPEA